MLGNCAGHLNVDMLQLAHRACGLQELHRHLLPGIFWYNRFTGRISVSVSLTVWQVN